MENISFRRVPGTLPVMPPVEDFDAARQQGRADALELAATAAPADPLLRIAWSAGVGDANLIHAAVEAAREAGATWGQVGAALGISQNTAMTRFAPNGYDRIRRYRERQAQAKDDASDA